jgi:hypothetical protein
MPAGDRLVKGKARTIRRRRPLGGHVVLSDTEGMLAGGGQEICLEKKDGAWSWSHA